MRRPENGSSISDWTPVTRASLAELAGLLGQVVEERRFAHTRVAAEHERLALPRPDCPEQPIKRFALVLSAEQHLRREPTATTNPRARRKFGASTPVGHGCEAPHRRVENRRIDPNPRRRPAWPRRRSRRTSRAPPTPAARLDELAAATADGPPLYELSPADARQVPRSVQAWCSGRALPGRDRRSHHPGGPTGHVNLRIVKPANGSGNAADQSLPTATGAAGSSVTRSRRTERLDRELATFARAIVVFVDYTPAPDAHYPVQNEQAYTALEWPSPTPGCSPAATRLVSRWSATASAAT